MNLRHAAALALVGWYLMIPPVEFKQGGSSSPYAVNPNARLLELDDANSLLPKQNVIQEVVKRLAEGVKKGVSEADSLQEQNARFRDDDSRIQTRAFDTKENLSTITKSLFIKHAQSCLIHLDSNW